MPSDTPTKPDLPAVVARTPLDAGMSEEAKQLIRQRLGVDEDNIPLTATDEERAAALNPGLPDPRSKTMDVKPGWKTTQFWLTSLMALVVLPVLGWLGNAAVSPLGDMLNSLAGVNPVLALAVPLAKASLFAFLAWCAHKLAANYDDNRTSLYAGSGATPAAIAAGSTAPPA